MAKFTDEQKAKLRAVGFSEKEIEHMERYIPQNMDDEQVAKEVNKMHEFGMKSKTESRNRIFMLAGNVALSILVMLLQPTIWNYFSFFDLKFLINGLIYALGLVITSAAIDIPITHDYRSPSFVKAITGGSYEYASFKSYETTPSKTVAIYCFNALVWFCTFTAMNGITFIDMARKLTDLGV